MDNKEAILNAIQDEYADTKFPEDFLQRYDMLECLSEAHGVETYLVSDKEGRLFVAKSFDKSVWQVPHESVILETLSHPALPEYAGTYVNEYVAVTVRTYIDGVSLAEYADGYGVTEEFAVSAALQLCDILEYLHTRNKPVIHRDIKPQNVIVRPDGSIALIDFDISRTFQPENNTDTQFAGTRGYAPPEQYGFMQTDVRTDIYSFGILLRFLLTKDDPNTEIYKPLAKIIERCTAFDPHDRYKNIGQVKKALLRANRRTLRLVTGLKSLCCGAAVFLIAFSGIKIYRAAAYDPFAYGAVPAYMSDEELIADSADYLNKKFETEIFSASDDFATVGYLRAILIDVYGLDRGYVYALNDGIPQESDDFFLPWGWGDEQYLPRDVVVYAGVKLHAPELVADWSSLKDDNGYYPGARVAVSFAEKTGILTGANRPDDVTQGEVALILANAERVFEASE